MNSARWNYFAYALIVSTCLSLYGFTLHFPFAFDDHIYVIDNPLFRDFNSFAYPAHFVEFARKSAALGFDPDLSTNFILRPFTYLTFYLNYAIGGFTTAGFRAVNIAIHCANGLLLFKLVRLLCHVSKKAPTSTVSAYFVALTTAMLFVAHPLQTESVTYIIQRFTSLATFWYLFTLYGYFRSVAANNDPARSTAWRWMAVAGLVAGMLSKETTFTAPIMLIVLDHFLIGTSFKEACRRALPFLLCLPLIPILVILTYWAQHGNVALDSALRITVPSSGSDYPYHYALTQPSVILAYLRLLFVPIDLNLDPDFPLCRSFWQVRVLAPIATILLLQASCIYWFRKHTGNLRTAIIFCSMIWFFVTISVSSSVVALPDVMADHRTYLSSIGLFLAVACALDGLRSRWEKLPSLRHAAVGGVVSSVLALGAMTAARNTVWATEFAIWKDTTAKSPKKARPWLNFGVVYFDQGNYTAAAECFRKVIQFEPGALDGYINLVATENKRGQLNEAIAVGLEAVKLTPAPKDHQLFENLGFAYNNRGDQLKGLEWFLKAVAARPDYRPAHLIVGNLYLRIDKYDEALKHFQIADKLQPLDPPMRRAVSELEAIVRRGSGTW